MTETENTKQNIAGNNRRTSDKKITKQKQHERKNKTARQKQERTNRFLARKQNIKDTERKNKSEYVGIDRNTHIKQGIKRKQLNKQK
jgi:hypothetical protein